MDKAFRKQGRHLTHAQCHLLLRRAAKAEAVGVVCKSLGTGGADDAVPGGVRNRPTYGPGPLGIRQGVLSHEHVNLVQYHKNPVQGAELSVNGAP